MPERVQETESGPRVSGRPIFGRFVAYVLLYNFVQSNKTPMYDDGDECIHQTVELIRFRRVLVHCPPCRCRINVIVFLYIIGEFDFFSTSLENIISNKKLPQQTRKKKQFHRYFDRKYSLISII